jgi:hypothetical protein
MKGKTIHYILSNDAFTKYIFDGFWFPDLPPKVQKNPALIIANTDKSTGPGVHWCAIFIDKDRGICEYFDPLGQPPESKLNNYSFLSHLNKYSPTVEYNSRPVQSSSAVTCGHHCIYFGFLKAKQYSLKSIITSFYSLNTYANDLKVLKFVKQSLSKNDSAYF